MVVDRRGLFSCSVVQDMCENICRDSRRMMCNSLHSALGVQITRVSLIRAVGRPCHEEGLESLVIVQV